MYNLFFDGHQKYGSMTLVAARSIAGGMARKAIAGTRLTYTWELNNVCVVHDAIYTHHVIKIVEVKS